MSSKVQKNFRVFKSHTEEVEQNIIRETENKNKIEIFHLNKLIETKDANIMELI
jgi:hypothetical protein